MTARRILVVGGVAAGPSAASKAARTNAKAAVTLFEQGEEISYGVCELPYYVGGEVAPGGLSVQTPESMRSEKRVDVLLRHRAEKIDPLRRILTVRDLSSDTVSEEKYDRLILATGSSAVKLNVPGETCSNVFHLKNLTDALRVRRYLEEFSPKRAVIIGAGYIGVETAEALRSRGLEVILLHNRPEPLPLMEKETRRAILELFERHSIHYSGCVQVAALEESPPGRVHRVRTVSGLYECDLVIVAIGVRPNVELARSCGIRIGTLGGILTDERQQTSREFIYAAGDCCEVRNLMTNARSYMPLATLASRTAWCAGENAAGGKAVFKGALRAIAIRIFESEFFQVGLSSEEARAAGFNVSSTAITAPSRGHAMPGGGEISVRLIADRRSRRLLGANLYGSSGAVLRGNTLAVAIHNRMTVDEVRSLDLAYSPPFGPLWDPVLVAANFAAKDLF